MLLVSAFSGQRIETVCGMSRQEVMDVVTHASASSLGRNGEAGASLSNLLESLNALYAQGIRGEFIRRAEERSCWFISRFGCRMDGHSIRAQVTRLMQAALAHRLWSSADVFLSM